MPYKIQSALKVTVDLNIHQFSEILRAKEEENKIQSYVGRLQAGDAADQLAELVFSQSFSFKFNMNILIWVVSLFRIMN